jgi:hypothetical protein
MSRSRIESLLTSFPKLIPVSSQHTSVETADVRYVYQPLEDLYIVLITNKASNILQDIETLHLLARVVSDQCRSAEQKEISKKSFDLLSAFDEIVNLGYREQLNITQVRNVLEMESHEEKIQEIIARVRELAQFRPRISHYPFRTRRPKQKRSSNAVQSSSRCNARSNRDELKVAFHPLRGSQETLAVIPLSLALNLLLCLANLHPRRLLCERPLSRALE